MERRAVEVADGATHQKQEGACTGSCPPVIIADGCATVLDAHTAVAARVGSLIVSPVSWAGIWEGQS